MPDLEPVILYHNPRCSKSRQALALLNEQGIEPQIIDYLNNPPTPEQLDKLLDLLGLEPRQLIRTGEPEYQQAGLDDLSLDRQALIAAMHRIPKLIERPIVISRGKAVIGRPPQRVLELVIGSD